jgi:hypothetical protein
MQELPPPRLGPELASDDTTSPREIVVTGQPRTRVPSYGV